MMSALIYLSITVTAIAGLWFVWDLGIKKLLLDYFRERLFELRFRLFQMAEGGVLPFDSPAYRSLETLLCGLLRYAHRISFAGLVLNFAERSRRKHEHEYVDYGKQIELRISQLNPDAQEKLNVILGEVHQMIAVYAALSSLLFMAAAVMIGVLHALGIVRKDSKREVVSVVESEVYRVESQRRPIMAAL